MSNLSGTDKLPLDLLSPPNKKLKRDCSNNDVEDSESKESCQSVYKQTLDDYDKLLLQCESPTNKVVEEYSKSNQNDGMEFDILDDLESDRNNDLNDENTDFDSSTDALDEQEIDDLLDAKLREFNSSNYSNKAELEEKRKANLKAAEEQRFEVLPKGWIEIIHDSGMPVYFHLKTRVCTMSKPYFLGPYSTRKHNIPVSAIPCLHYFKEKEKLKAETEDSPVAVNSNGESENTPVADTNNPSEAINKDAEITNKIANGIFPSAILQSAKDVAESLDCSAVRNYCEKRFDFQTIAINRFSLWPGKKQLKRMKLEGTLSLRDDTKLSAGPKYGGPGNPTISFTNFNNQEFTLDIAGKSSVCILHEYSQCKFKVHPKYEFKRVENEHMLFGASVTINGIEYGSGCGRSKKFAKIEAARSALEILLPGIKLPPGNEETQNIEFFDQIKVDEPTISDLSQKSGQPFPFQILLKCLHRNYGMDCTKVEYRMTEINNEKKEFYMKFGEHVVSGECWNKKHGKNMGSQAILQKLHPHASSWGFFLRMYGKESSQAFKEKKEEEKKRIAEQQSKAYADKPSTSNDKTPVKREIKRLHWKSHHSKHRTFSSNSKS